MCICVFVHTGIDKDMHVNTAETEKKPTNGRRETGKKKDQDGGVKRRVQGELLVTSCA